MHFAVATASITGQWICDCSLSAGQKHGLQQFARFLCSVSHLCPFRQRYERNTLHPPSQLLPLEGPFKTQCSIYFQAKCFRMVLGKMTTRLL